MGPALRDADTPQRFEFDDLDLVVNIRAGDESEGNLHWEWSDDGAVGAEGAHEDVRTWAPRSRTPTRPSASTRLPDLRTREASLRSQLEALDAQSADQQVYLKLAHDLDTFLAGLRTTAATSDVHERQRIVRLLVKDVLVGPEKITIRHRIPVREHTPAAGTTPQPPTRRVTIPQVPHCVGGVITPPWGAPSSVARNPPSSITPAFSHCAHHLPTAGNVPNDSQM